MSRAESGRSLPPGLHWQPAPAPGAPAETACRFGLSDVAAEDFSRGQYEVVHYAPAACGLAYGPLSLGQVVRFCQDLTAKLQLYERVVFQYGPAKGERANCAVLLGAFLVLCKGWSANMAASVLRSEAKLGFVCSWAQPTKAQTPVMNVKDCWDGLELAGSQGWLRIGAWQAASPASARLEAQLVELGVSQYSRLALQYDACWLVPGEILVMADPITTIKDPNPSTCPSFQPLAEAVEEQGEDLQPNSPDSLVESAGDLHSNVPARVEPEVEVRKSSSKRTTHSTSCGSVREPDSLDSKCVCEFSPPADVNEEEENNTSLHSVCKIYQDVTAFGPEEVNRPKALDFISLLQKHGVGVVVRTNASNEEGLREIGGSYDPAALREQGIHHLDLFVKDVNGGIPPPQLIRSFLLEVDGVAPQRETGGSPATFPASPASAGAPPSAEGEGGAPPSAPGDGAGGARAPAVVVHCKSGFGRSVLLACLLVIHRHDVPGRALLGWARMVRPGAFTVPEQERFLCGLGGRGDLHRLAGLVESGPCKCCSVQ